MAEARWYLALTAAAEATNPSELAACEGPLAESLRALAGGLGSESMITRLALHQHSRLVNAALDRSFPLGATRL